MMNNKFRVLFIAPLPPPATGQTVGSLTLLEGLKKYCDIEIINLSNDAFRQEDSLSRRITRALWVVFMILAKQRDADVIYFAISLDAVGNIRDLLVYLACFLKLPQMLLHLHGGKITFGKSQLFYYLNKFFLKRVGRIIVLSNSFTHIFEGMVPKDKSLVVQNCAADHMFLSKKAVLDKYRNIRPLRILFLSNFIPGKGYDELVEAYNNLNNELKKMVKIDFAGEFLSEEQKVAFLDKIRDIKEISYQGVLNESGKREPFFRAHIFCLPTYYYYEGQPVSILEAYASGCVVVTTNQGGIRDIFSDRVNGFLVDGRSPGSIKKVIEDILKDPSVLAQIALRNRELAEKEFNKSRYVSSFVEIIEKLKPRVV